MAEIDWNELIGSKKSARACDKHSCGNVMAQYDDKNNNRRCYNKITLIYKFQNQM
jgi:hypothetical protein